MALFLRGRTALDLWQNSDFGEGHRRFMELAKRLHRISDRYFFTAIGSIRDMLDHEDDVQAQYSG